jgi:predicted TPR repeat methyltransferase
MAIALFQKGEIAKGLAELARYCAETPNDAATMNQLGTMLYEQGRTADALAWFKRAITANPQFEPAWTNYGIALQGIGRHEEAGSAFQKGAAIVPQAPAPIAGIGSLLRKTGQAEKAVGYLQRAIDLAEPVIVKSRIHLAGCLFDLGRNDEAKAEAKKLVPYSRRRDFPHLTFGTLLGRLGLSEQAQQHIDLHLRDNPDDKHCARMLMAQIGMGPPPERAPTAFLLKAYADISLTWDRSSSYQAHLLVGSRFEQISNGRAALSILDVGCGTGLVGALVRPKASVLQGVDLSPEMLARAEEKKLYDGLYQTDALTFLREHPANYDFVLSAATLIHFGDLEPVFRAMHSALKPDGCAIFTVFPNPDENSYAVGPAGLAEGGIFVHGTAYLRSVAELTSFRLDSCEEGIHEHHNGKAKIGLCVCLSKLPHPSTGPQ